MAKANATTRGHRFKDIAGQSFGYLRAIRVSHTTTSKKLVWECLCEQSLGGCGATALVVGAKLVNGHTKSCGCLVSKTSRRVNTTHGMTHTPEYQTWYGMKYRCGNPRHKSFADYGGRGIRVCDRWLHSFENFLADMGKKPTPKHSLDRIDNDGNYEPGNCRWATRTQQTQNTSRNTILTFNGETKCLSEWARSLGRNPSTLCCRIARGLPIERVLS